MERTSEPAPAGGSAPRRGVRVAAVAAAAWLAACSPEHDWREIRADDAHLVVMLPAKPSRMTRTIHLETLKVDMTMVGAQAADVAYTVGAVVLPDDREATRERAVAAMRAAMVRNIGGTERASRPVRVGRVDAAGRPAGAVDGVEVEATGRMRDADAVLIARFAADGRRAWQAVVLGANPDREQAAQFLESLRVRP